MKRLSLLLLLIFSLLSYAQDSTRSQAFKKPINFNKYPLIRPKYPDYPLMASFMLMKSAQEGDPFAQHELGLRYLLGRGLPADTVLAVKWIREAAKKDISSAKYNYGILLSNEIGVEWDPFTAFKNFRFAAEAGMAEAQYILGLYYTDNFVVNRNLNIAYQWLKKSLKNGMSQAKNVLVRLEEMGINLESPSDEEMQTESAEILEDNAAQTLLENKFELDYINFQDDTVKTNKNETFYSDIFNRSKEELLDFLNVSQVEADTIIIKKEYKAIIESAASAGSPEAYLLLAYLTQHGIEFRKNEIKAAMYYLRAYRLGERTAMLKILDLVGDEKFIELLKRKSKENEPDALFTFSTLTALGLNYQLTEQQAIELLDKASELNHIPSLIEAGLVYYYGNGVQRDKERGLELWRRAANLGSGEAQIRLAFIEITEHTFNNDIMDTVQIFEKGVMEGSILASTAIAYCYEQGYGKKRSKFNALKYYRMSASRGSNDAFRMMQNLYDQIRPLDDEFKIYTQ